MLYRQSISLSDVKKKKKNTSEAFPYMSNSDKSLDIWEVYICFAPF